MKTQDEIDTIAWKFYVDKDGIVPNTYEREGFTNGYTQCQEDMADKKYTEEDMIGFLDWSLGMEVVEMLCNNKTKQEIFQEYIIYKAYAEARRNNSLNKQD
jgi:hypothetical protein